MARRLKILALPNFGDPHRYVAETDLRGGRAQAAREEFDTYLAGSVRISVSQAAW
jgi:hypothetical protein